MGRSIDLGRVRRLLQEIERAYEDLSDEAKESLDQILRGLEQARRSGKSVASEWAQSADGRRLLRHLGRLKKEREKVRVAEQETSIQSEEKHTPEPPPEAHQYGPCPPDAQAAKEFWEKWSDEKREKWFKAFEKTYKSYILNSAKRHGVPVWLLAALIANEMIDYPWNRQFYDRIGLGGSVGPAQIRVSTVKRDLGQISLDREIFERVVMHIQSRESLKHIKARHYREKLFKGSCRNKGWDEGWPEGWPRNVDSDDPSDTAFRMYLSSCEGGIDIAGHLLRKYLDDIRAKYEENRLSPSFVSLVIGGNLGFLGEALDAVDKGVLPNLQQQIVLLRAMAIYWNNGPRITDENTVKNIKKEAEEGLIHADNAGELEGRFRDWNDW